MSAFSWILFAVLATLMAVDEVASENSAEDDFTYVNEIPEYVALMQQKASFGNWDLGTWVYWDSSMSIFFTQMGTMGTPMGTKSVPAWYDTSKWTRILSYKTVCYPGTAACPSYMPGRTFLMGTQGLYFGRLLTHYNIRSDDSYDDDSYDDDSYDDNYNTMTTYGLFSFSDPQSMTFNTYFIFDAKIDGETPCPEYGIDDDDDDDDNDDDDDDRIRCREIIKKSSSYWDGPLWAFNRVATFTEVGSGWSMLGYVRSAMFNKEDFKVKTSFSPSDVNEDGLVDIMDIIIVVNVILYGDYEAEVRDQVTN